MSRAKMNPPYHQSVYVCELHNFHLRYELSPAGNFLFVSVYQDGIALTTKIAATLSEDREEWTVDLKAAPKDRTINALEHFCNYGTTGE